LIDGQALSFHGDAWKMFRGFILLVVLMGVYAGAGRLSPFIGLPAFIALCAVWPALWRASLQFRLANTSWRGLRFSFTGSLKGAYAAVAALYLPMMFFVAASIFAGEPPTGGNQQQKDAFEARMLWVLLPMLASLACGPLFLAQSKRYQHNGYRLADQQGRLILSNWAFYKLSLKAAALCLLPVVLAVGAAVAAMAVLRNVEPATAQGLSAYAVVGGMLLFYLLLFALLGPYFAARMQNMVWTATRSQSIGFESRLRFRSLMWLTLKNWVLVALTLGLFRPFAAVNTARLRLQAMTVTLSADVDAWQTQAAASNQDATGDIAGDFFGIDMGL
jgi:uncharacterized membrane protein YjgN (DUF898 family)